MEYSNRFFIFSGLFTGILLTILQAVLGSEHIVSWEVSGNQSLYRERGHGSTFVVGDTLVFRIEDAIARVVSKSEYEACTAEGSKALIYRGGEGIELNTSGSWYFMSRIHDRCKSGEKILIRVDAGESIVGKHSLRMGRGAGNGGGGGGNGGASGNAGGLNTPRGNRDHPIKKNAAYTLTPPSMDFKLFVLLMLCSIFFNPA